MARGAAAYRAIHQTLDGGSIFRDPYASRILSAETLATLDEIAADLSLRPMRLFVAARSRYSEDAFAACVARGVQQIVVLGAGLDTFSLRNPFADQGVRIARSRRTACSKTSKPSSHTARAVRPPW